MATLDPVMKEHVEGVNSIESRRKPQTKTQQGKRKASQATKNGSSSESTGVVEPPSKKPRTTAGRKKATSNNSMSVKDADQKKPPSPPASNPGAAESTDPRESSQEVAEEKYKWWEEANLEDGEVKWETLEHAGVLFPPEYEPLPNDVHLIYNKRPVWLPPAAEEVAGFFGAMLHSDHVQNNVFCENFFRDFLATLEKSGVPAKFKDTQQKAVLEEFRHCDFSVIHQYYQRLSEDKKALSRDAKKRLREEKLAAEDRYRWCLMDGRRQPVGNFRVEPPSLFRGRGNHPKTGRLKARVQPEDVIINIGKDAPVPEPPQGHTWGSIQHDNTVVWLAAWKENINGTVKYVRLANNSDVKGMSDFRKFEKARELKNYIDGIRKDYLAKLTSTQMLDRQRATAMYLIDVLALRAGGEKGDEEADTVGCCSLRCEHLTLEEPNLVTFDFLGKDSVRFYQQVRVDRQVWLNLRILTREPKEPSDDVFDRLDTDGLNKHLRQYMPGLSAKVFRTFNASLTMQQQLDKIPVDTGSVQEKVVAFNAANRAVAILCNHQRNVGKGHDKSMENQEERIEEMVWQRMRLKRRALAIDPSLKTKRKAWFSEFKSMPVSQQHAVADRIGNNDRAKQRKKFERDQTRHRDDPENHPVPSEDALAEKLAAVDSQVAAYHSEIKTGKFDDDCKLPASVEKLDAQIQKLDDRIANARLVLQDRQDNSTVALTTSKINYIDPRLTAMFSKRYNVPIEKLFNKTLREKFAWAIESAGEDWKF